MKQTPEQILDSLTISAIYGAPGGFAIKGKKEALSALKEYYILSDAELREMLPEKKVIGMFDHYGQNRVFNDAIDLCFQALRGRIGREERNCSTCKYMFVDDLPEMCCNHEPVCNNHYEYYQAIKDKEREI
ncbi:MAG: hypothetical protein ABGF52_13535 [Candidatus Asgardarchaeum sp.]